ncbi:cation:proton antiporter [Coleofasciculus sp. F4-SAH-05]|uniref:cation:proton antiporter n=1 Tax=Coleofasciculus sp. F4-SAH-05 TaxID=3069525 RepID=UPI0032FC0770
MAKRPNHSRRRQHNTTFLGKIKDKSIRKIKARTEENLSVLYGLTLMGFVSFDSLYELFTPFFFIGIGLKINPSALTAALGMGGILLVAAVLGKLIGAGGPTLLTTGWTGAALIGVSMVPRAEITMIVMGKGLSLGEWAVSNQVFAAMVVVSAVTSILAPIILRSLLNKLPEIPTGVSN